MVRRTLLAATGWLAAAVVVAFLSTAMLDTLGIGLLGQSAPPLTAGEVGRQLAAGPAARSHQPCAQCESASPSSPSAVPSPSAPASSPPATSPTVRGTRTGAATAGVTAATQGTTASSQGQDKALATPGGSIVARCGGGLAELVSWSPSQGYFVANVNRGPAPTASLVFAGGERRTFLVNVTCAGGTPQAAVVRRGEGDDHD